MSGPCAQQFRAARAWLGWSRDQAADRSGLSPTTLHRLEAGEAARLHTTQALTATYKAEGIGFIGRQAITYQSPGAQP